MSENVTINDETVESKANLLVEAVRKVFLASIGAAKIAQEEVTGFVTDTENYLNKVVEDTEAFVNKLVDKGAIAESDGKQLISDMVEKRKSVVEDSRSKVNIDLDGRVEGVLAKLNIPTKGDIDELSKKIGQLSRKVDNLRKVQEKALAEEAAPVVEKATKTAEKTTKASTKKAKETAKVVAEAVDGVAA
jgi:poly(hydroxyalkanoate) granule-associated protein